MAEHWEELERRVPASGLLGYLNFSDGKPDPRWQRQLNEAYRFFAERGSDRPWQALHDWLSARLGELRSSGAAAFRDAGQAEALLALTVPRVLPAYHRHHADLLFHQTDRQLFQPFFLGRVFEAVLAQGPPWDDESRIVAGALNLLNDYVGHRPVAILETRPRGEPYDHERVRPIPLYLRGAGTGWGPYHDLVVRALEIIAATDPDLLAQASFDLDLLDELAVDPRAIDHNHPANRRPNYIFGEWDPHHLDHQGRYRRYVARQITLDALLDRVENGRAVSRDELLFEAAAVLAGTLLMATGISGSGPTAHDSTATLANLMPAIARYRDTFYARLLEKVGGEHGRRLREEAAAAKQPFGGARQHINQYLSRHRALQLQQRHLTLIFAEMGYPQASRQEAAKIPAASARLLSEIHGRLTVGHRLAEAGDVAAAARVLPEAKDLLKRGIACGAFADPWNILGFQGLFPLSAAREESVRDTRIDELVDLVDHVLDLYSWLMAEAAATGDGDLRAALSDGMGAFASWWDQYASSAVSDVRLVLAGKVVNAAEAVAAALAQWNQRGEAAGDLAFWKKHLRHFDSPQAFAQIVDLLLFKQDYRASMALLMTWLGQTESVELEEGEYSFHALALRWMLSVTSAADSSVTRDSQWLLVKRFLDHVEANAEDYWQVPSLEGGTGAGGEHKDEEDDDLYSAAYEGVTYRDSADDGTEGAVEDLGPPREAFSLEEEVEQLAKRLRFLSTVARLWLIAARAGYPDPAPPGGPEGRGETLAAWLDTAETNRQRLLTLLNAVDACPVPEPLGNQDALMEYDRRRVLKEQLLNAVIATCLETSLAVGALRGAVPAGEAPATSEDAPDWQPLVIRLEQALLHADAAEARRVLPAFLDRFRQEPLLYTALADRGPPRQVLRVRLAQTILQALAATLPRLGLLRETYHLLRTARVMEQERPAPGRGVSQFNELFDIAFQAAVGCLVDSAFTWGPAEGSDPSLAVQLESLTGPFLALWIDYSRTLQLSVLETVRGDGEWQALREFIRRYGKDLFHARFMTLANLRGILHRGAGAYLDYLRDNPDPLHPVRLVEELDSRIDRETAVRYLQFILQAVVENYEEYKDYNTTTAQSDYGENLHVLLDFLRLKASYERHAWQFRPLVLAHAVLARRGRSGTAVLWEEGFTRVTRDLTSQHLDELARLEQKHGTRLVSVRDRLEERFVRPLAQDRLCALIEPALEEASPEEDSPAFARLRLLLQSFAASPTGVGLDVPHWLRRLEAEVERVRAAQTEVAELAKNLARVPSRAVSYAEFRRQIEEWEKPL